MDALLERMDAIANAVNSFTSEAVQQEALSALIAAFEGRSHGNKSPHPPAPEKPQPYTEPDQPEEAPPNANKGAKPKSSKPKNTGRGSTNDWKMVKDLNLHPSSKPSFADFIEGKKPSSNEDRYAVVVYYLSEILGVSAVTIHQVGTIFRLTKSWKEPTNLASGLRVASSRKGTIDTRNYEDIKITPAGRNFVDHDLPSKPKGSK